MEMLGGVVLQASKAAGFYLALIALVRPPESAWLVSDNLRLIVLITLRKLGYAEVEGVELAVLEETGHISAVGRYVA